MDPINEPFEVSRLLMAHARTLDLFNHMQPSSSDQRIDDERVLFSSDVDAISEVISGPFRHAPRLFDLA